MNNDLKILFVDEADLLNVDGFEFLRYIFNKTGCPIVVVGLRQILRVIREYEKFGSRVGPHIEFRPPDEDEVLTKILPQLLVPHWKYDLSSEADIAMGYDAIMAHRRPHPRVATGLLWHLPGGIHTTVPFPLTSHAACARGKIGVEEVHAELIGYNHDPAWQFPLLRELLPVGVGCIDSEGSVLYDGLHYTHDLLSYWQGHPVTLRRSEWSESTAWIYLDGEILCQAHARELRRRDGSYRHFRSER